MFTILLGMFAGLVMAEDFGALHSRQYDNTTLGSTDGGEERITEAQAHREAPPQTETPQNQAETQTEPDLPETRMDGTVATWAPRSSDDAARSDKFMAILQPLDISPTKGKGVLPNMLSSTFANAGPILITGSDASSGQDQVPVSSPILAAGGDAPSGQEQVSVSSPILAAGGDASSGQDQESDPDVLPPASGQDTAADEPPQQDPGAIGRATLDLSAQGSLQVSAIAGRVTTLEFNRSAPSSVEILSGPAYGNVTVNPDNSLALVLTGTTRTSDLDFDIRATLADGRVRTKTVELDIAPGQQDAGWGLGDFYMLQSDADGDLIVEPGETHRKVYVSASKDALTLDDIAALENLQGMDNSKWAPWARFFADNPEYGASPDMALAEDGADHLWRALTHKEGPQSHWLLFERGYSYDTITTILGGTTGESELHPTLIGAWGNGDRPLLDIRVNSHSDTGNIVFQGLEFVQGVRLLNKENLLFDDIVSTGAKFNIRSIDDFTLRNSAIYDVYRDAPIKVSDDGAWAQGANRTSGIFMGDSEGVLLENMLFDHNGWADGYDPGLSADDPQPPSKFNHNIYFDFDNHDVTLRDSIVMRASANGAQFRGGAVIEDSVFLDNNGSLMFGAGGKKLASGNYSLLNGGVVTSAGYKIVEDAQGTFSVGVTNQGYLATVTDTIITHMADPDNPAEIAEKVASQAALQHKLGEPVYDDAVIYNWLGSVRADDDATDRNIEGLDASVLDDTTIQNFAAQLLGRNTATITDLADYLRAQADGAFDTMVDADLIIAFFRTGFGLDTELRADADTLRFVPNELADGMRWDNRMNWDSNDLPGTRDGDRVELGGNWVVYGGTSTIEDLDFGDGGRLSVTHGYLEVADHVSVGDGGAVLTIDHAGQFWTNGYSDDNLLTIEAAGGRFANTGLFTGTADMEISGNAEVILATGGADYALGAGSNLSITGGTAKVGFDGEANKPAVLLMSKDAELSFTAQGGELGGIREFFSGHFGEGQGVRSGINLGGISLDIDVMDLGGQAGTHELMRVDEIIGDFGKVKIDGLDLNAQNAVLVIDYTADIVALQLGAPGVGTGAVAIDTRGNADDAKTGAALYDALTSGHGIYASDLPSSIPPVQDDDPFAL